MEGAFLLAVQAVRIDGLTQVMALISSLGASALVWVVLALALLLFEERRECGAIMIVAMIVASILTALAANFVGRAYPTESVTGLVAVVGVSHAGFCFPSLHAATCAAAVTVLLRSGSRAIGSAGLVLAVLICISRLYLGVNYPSDIVVGVILGCVVALLCHAVLSRVLAFLSLNAQPRQPARKQVNSKRGRHSL